MKYLLIVMVLATAASAALVEQVEPVRQTDIQTPLAFPTRAAAAPTIDGKLDEACWASATKMGPLLESDTRLAAAEAAVGYICYDDQAIYLAVEAVEEQMPFLGGRENGDKEDAWGGDEIEFFIAPHGDGKTFYQFCVGPLYGQRYDARNDLGKKYHGNWTSAVHLDKPKNRYTIEVRIPYADFKMTGAPTGQLWGFNIARSNMHSRQPQTNWPGESTDSSEEHSQWSPTGSSFHAINRFGRLFFGTAEQFTKMREPVHADLLLDRYAYDKLDRDAQAVLSVRGGGRGLDALSAKLKLQRDGATVVEQDLGVPVSDKLSFLLPLASLKPGKYTLQATVSAAGSEPSLATWSFDLTDKGLAEGVARTGRIALKLPPRDADKRGFAWPVRTGVPFPKGALDDPAKARLLINGKPAPCQTSVRARWSPRGSIRWLGLTFVAIDPGATYELEYGGATPSAPASPVKVTTTDKGVSVDTGQLRFVVGKNGITSASINGKPAITAADGASPYIVDNAGKLHRAEWSDDAKVEVEETGPVHAVVRVSGWFAAKDGAKLCKYTTYYEAFAGLPHVFVDHAVVITYDTTKNKLRDIGFPVAATGAQYAIGIEDGKAITGNRAKDVFAVQDRFDHYLVRGETTVEGKQLAGWADAGNDDMGVTVSGQYVWQRFPTEFSANKTALTYHLWPRDLGDTFTAEQELARENIYKFFYAHEGPALNFQLPQSYFDKLTEYAAKEPFDLWYSSEGLQANGQGVAVNEPFVITFRDKALDPVAATAFARLGEQSPHAIADPKWTSLTEAMGQIAAADPEKYPQVARFAGPAFLAMCWPAIKENNEYGKFNFGDVHTYWQWWKEPKAADIHRCWLSHHYGQTDIIWLLYAFYGEPKYLEWARINNHHTMNINMVHYEDPAHPIRYHSLGATYHVKGLVHWGGDTAITSHHAWSTYLNWAWMLTGNRRARDIGNEWVEGVTAAQPSGTAGRDGQNALGHLVNFYEHRWDPRLLLLMESFATTMFSTPLEDQHAADWNPATFYAYCDLRHDPRALAAIDSPKFRNDGGSLHMNAYLYLRTGNAKYLEAMDSVYETLGVQFTEPGHLYDGIGLSALFLQVNNLSHQAMVIQKAFARAGKPITPDLKRQRPVVVETGPYTRSSPQQYTLGVIKAAGQAVTINTGGNAELVGKIKITGPDGAGVSAIDASAAPGMYSILVQSTNLVAVSGAEPFFLVKAGQSYGLLDDTLASIAPLAGDGPIEIKFYAGDKHPVRLAILNAEGKEVAMATSWYRYENKQKSLTIPAGGPYRIIAPFPTTIIVADRDLKLKLHSGVK